MNRTVASAGARSLRGAALVLLLLGLPAEALPHAIVLESSPAHDAVLEESPNRVVLRFNSRIEPRLTRVTLAAGAGEPVAMAVAVETAGGDGAAGRLTIPLRPLGPGTYVLRYRVLATDGHITEGALRFTVGGRR